MGGASVTILKVNVSDTGPKIQIRTRGPNGQAQKGPEHFNKKGQDATIAKDDLREKGWKRVSTLDDKTVIYWRPLGKTLEFWCDDGVSVVEFPPAKAGELDERIRYVSLQPDNKLAVVVGYIENSYFDTGRGAVRTYTVGTGAPKLEKRSEVERWPRAVRSLSKTQVAEPETLNTMALDYGYYVYFKGKRTIVVDGLDGQDHLRTIRLKKNETLVGIEKGRWPDNFNVKVIAPAKGDRGTVIKVHSYAIEDGAIRQLR